MATAPYNYSYIFKYIIIGKYKFVPSTGIMLIVNGIKLLSASFEVWPIS